MLRLMLIPLAIIATIVLSDPLKRMSYTCIIAIQRNCYINGHSPVCGTNNVTYYNRCEFSQAHCRDPKVHFAHNGTCGADSHKANLTHGEELVLQFVCQHIHLCPSDFDPVCGSDGVTYSNECEYEKERCLHPDMHIQSKGECPSTL